MTPSMKSSMKEAFESLTKFMLNENDWTLLLKNLQHQHSSMIQEENHA